MENLNNYLAAAKTAALKGGQKILEVYHGEDFNIEIKGDNSPLTRADKLAHHAICDILETTGLPILSEEGKDIPFEERSQWDYFWMVDPLDGTKEFIKRNGEFTVNIALIHNNTPIMGVVYVPVQDKLYYGGHNIEATMEHSGKTSSLTIRPVSLNQPNLRVVASRSHLNDETQEFMNALAEPTIVSMGSSLKFMALAEGLADVYPRFAPTMEWDTAAAHAVILAAGGSAHQKGTNLELKYNKEDLLNPHFLVAAVDN